MRVLKVRIWRPDTHPGHTVEVEWEYDTEDGSDTGREHQGVSIRYPDGTHIHRDAHGHEVTDEHYKRLLAEHVTKNHIYNTIVDFLPARMKKTIVDSDGDALLDDAGLPRLGVKDKHRPVFRHIGKGCYEFTVPGIDRATHNDLVVRLSEFGSSVTLTAPGLKLSENG